MSKAYWKFNKKDIERLLAKRAGIGRDSLACAAETNELLLCWATSAQQANDARCRPYEVALQRCEVAMGNKAGSRARAEIQKTIVQQLLRYANKQNKADVLENLK